MDDRKQHFDLPTISVAAIWLILGGAGLGRLVPSRPGFSQSFEQEPFRAAGQQVTDLSPTTRWVVQFVLKQADARGLSRRNITWRCRSTRPQPGRDRGQRLGILVTKRLKSVPDHPNSGRYLVLRFRYGLLGRYRLNIFPHLRGFRVLGIIRRVVGQAPGQIPGTQVYAE